MTTRQPGDSADGPDRPEQPGSDNPTVGQPGVSGASPGGSGGGASPGGSGGPNQPGEFGPGAPGFGSTPPAPGAPPPAGYVPPGQPHPTTPREQPPRQGSIQRQEAGVTQPRPPTVAEARARDKARKRAEEAQRAAAAAAEGKRRTRNRVLIGGVAIVGVAGLVGGGYLTYRALTAPDRVTASCVQINENGQEVVVEDQYCGTGRTGFVDDDYRPGAGVVLLGGWPQYRYYYGGTTTVGKAPVGGTTVRPKSADVKTKSGTTVQRGGLGSKSTGGSGS